MIYLIKFTMVGICLKKKKEPEYLVGFFECVFLNFFIIYLLKC